MSADEHLQPRQFGPGGKYTTKPVGPRHIEAVHTGSSDVLSDSASAWARRTP